MKKSLPSFVDLQTVLSPELEVWAIPCPGCGCILFAPAAELLRELREAIRKEMTPPDQDNYGK